MTTYDPLCNPLCGDCCFHFRGKERKTLKTEYLYQAQDQVDLMVHSVTTRDLCSAHTGITCGALKRLVQVTPEPEKQEEDCSTFEASLVYVAGSRPAKTLP